ncbi:MAG: hypothetical protein M3296_07880, partial [Actinomycetota bacterium]|nr:hypothetical protein [Actinomycetota bacterium]
AAPGAGRSGGGRLHLALRAPWGGRLHLALRYRFERFGRAAALACRTCSWSSFSPRPGTHPDETERPGR